MHWGAKVQRSSEAVLQSAQGSLQRTGELSQQLHPHHSPNTPCCLDSPVREALYHHFTQMYFWGIMHFLRLCKCLHRLRKPAADNMPVC